MATIVTRSVKGSALTHTEMDSNFSNLNDDKAELAGASFTSNVDVTGTLSSTGALSTTGDLSTTKTFTGRVGTDVASGADLSLGDGNMFDITGTTDITSIGTVGVGTYITLQFDDVLVLTNHATDLVLPNGNDIITYSGYIIQLYEYATGDYRFVSDNRTILKDLPPKHLTGLILSNDTDTVNDINITAGYCTDSTDAYSLNLATEITKQIDATWAAGDDAGGLFSGTVAADTTYHVFLILKDSDGSIDAGFDTSLTAANIPAGYTAYRRIGSILTNATSGIYQFTQTDDRFDWDDVASDFSVAFHTGRVSRTIKVPQDIEFIVTYAAGGQCSTTLRYVWYGSLNTSTFTPTAALSTLQFNSANAGQSNTLSIKTNTSGQIGTECNGTSGTLFGYTVGWTDSRGKL